ncbi:ankyrin repeat protein [Xylaria arbuscula]|nr:ankyrin repeat protein [Xylaria arbuscula]
MADDPSPIPRPPSQFLSHLSDHPQIETRELLQPYLAYEAWLRMAFARGDTGIDNFANVVPIYNGCEHAFRIRTIDRETADGEKYIMPLLDDEREEDSALAITASIEKYWRNFNGFSHGILADLDWSNIVVAGSAALLPLLSRRRDIPTTNDLYIDGSPENYFETIASKSDIDIFLYGLDSDDAAITLIFQLESMIRNNQNLFPGEGLSMRSKNAITFISPKRPYRHVQVILRLYKSISEILTGVDVDCACVVFDGRQVYSNPRGIAAISTRTNTINLSLRGPAYENRLCKYRSHNFEVFWNSLERSQISAMLFDTCIWRPKDQKGLARLLTFEQMLQNEQTGWWGKEYGDWGRKPLKSLDEMCESSLSVPSKYALYEIPYGEDYTVERFLEDFRSHPEDPCLRGAIQNVINGRKSEARGEDSLVGKVNFIQHIPGQQMLENFEPMVEDDWTEMAYV